jgi:hypothetical protein
MFPDLFPDLFPDPVSDQFASLATRTPFRASVLRPAAVLINLALHGCPEGFRCPEHISAPKDLGSKRISVFYAHFLESPRTLWEGDIYMLWYRSA